jgi:hypothetical protein
LCKSQDKLAAVAGNFRNAAGGATLNLNASGVVFPQDADDGLRRRWGECWPSSTLGSAPLRRRTVVRTGCKGSLANLNTTTAYRVDDAEQCKARLLISARSVNRATPFQFVCAASGNDVISLVVTGGRS